MISAVTLISTIGWYPFRELIESLVPVADEIVVNVDIGLLTTLEIVHDMKSEFPIRIVQSHWNWTAKDKGQELARQANFAIQHAGGDWLLYVQGDELLHENEHADLLKYVRGAPDYISGFELDRLYFFGRPDMLRLDWTMPLKRFFRKDSHMVVGDGMNTRTLWGKVVPAYGCRLYHYSRLAPGNEIVDRIMDLSRLFHDEKTLTRPATYDFKTREYDSFSSDNPPSEVDPEEVLVPWDGTHPKYIRPWLVRTLQERK